MGFFDFFRRPPRIDDAAALALFIDQRAAFVAQKGLYDYSQARSGHYAKVLLAESGFRDAMERSRWQAYPLGLTMVGEIAEGILRPSAGERRRDMLDGLIALVLEVFDRYPVPAALGAAAWSEARREVARQLDLVGLHPPKFAKDVPERFAQEYFDLMPIHESLRTRDVLTTRNYLRATLCNIHEELTKRIDTAAVVPILLAHRDG